MGSRGGDIGVRSERFELFWRGRKRERIFLFLFLFMLMFPILSTQSVVFFFFFFVGVIVGLVVGVVCGIFTHLLKPLWTYSSKKKRQDPTDALYHNIIRK